MRLLAVSLTLLAASLSLSPIASGKSTDRNQPMDVQADNTDAVMEDNSDSTLNGNVIITQGTLQIKADRAIIHRRDGDIDKVTLTGNPVVMKQVNDNGEPMNAQAATIVYTLSSDLILLNGNVIIDQPRGSMRGENVKYDLKTGRLNGGGDGNRVSMRIMPKNKAPVEAKP
ncbi:MAG: lipopolysaccharide transport periplasmic protein LptA [Arenimonas sp.]